MRWAAVACVAGVVACGGDRDDKGARKQQVQDTAVDATIAPPSACPVGDLMLSEWRMERDISALELWNGLRTTGGSCDGVPMDPTNALAADEALMWTARCWAFDISVNGPPPASDQFSDGSTLGEVAAGFGFQGALNGWGVQGDRVSVEAAFAAWVDGGGSGCTRLWDDALVGGTGVSGAGDILVITRLAAFGPG